MSDLGSFDESVFDAALSDFERNLGELRGIEMAHERFDSIVRSFNGSWNIGGEAYWDVPSEKHPFQVILISTIINFDVTQEEIVAAMNAEFENGKTWAAGVAGRFRELTLRFREVDTGVIATAAGQLETRVAGALQGVISGDFASNPSRGTSLSATLEHWEGRAQNSFTTFYSGLSDKVNLWAAIASSTAGLYAAHAVIMDGCQTSLQKYMDQAVDHTDAQLANWAASHASWPYESTKGAVTPGEILDVISLGASVAALIPPAAPVAGTVGAVTGIVSTVLGMVGTAPPKNAEFTAEKAFDIYQDTYDNVNLEIMVPTVSAMINLRNGSSGDLTGTADIADEIEGRGSDFFTPRLPGIADPGPDDWWFNDGAFG